MKIEVFERLLTENDEKYGVKFTIGSQSFKLDYYGDREEIQWMKDMLIQAINNLIAQTREETISEVEKMIKKEFPHQKLYCEAQDLQCEILDELNKLKK